MEIFYAASIPRSSGAASRGYATKRDPDSHQAAPTVEVAQTCSSIGFSLRPASQLKGIKETQTKVYATSLLALVVNEASGN